MSHFKKEEEKVKKFITNKNEKLYKCSMEIL